MAKWVERAKAALAKQRGSRFQRASLEDTLRQTDTIVDDIRFVMQTSGSSIEGIALDRAGLDRVEAFYRTAIRAGDNVIELGVDNFERLMAVMLGQSLVTLKGARWIVYEGKYHVLDPIVVQLMDGKYADVFMFCKCLSQKSGVPGGNQGHALSSYLDNVDRMAFP